jgi:hypothetical protein
MFGPCSRFSRTEISALIGKPMAPVTYKLPDQLNDARFKTLLKAQDLVKNLQSDSYQRLSTAIHEAGHFVSAQRLGLTPRYKGQAIEFVSDESGWTTVFGAVQVPLYDFLELSIEHMAAYHLAGKVAEIVLLGMSSDKASEGSQSDFEQFIYSGFASVPEIVLLWKQAEETAICELRSDLDYQREIIHAASRAEAELFGPDRSVRRTL